MGDRRAHSRIRSVQLPARLDPSYGGLLTIGTETVTAHPGDRTVVYPFHANPVDPVAHGRTAYVATHRRYL